MADPGDGAVKRGTGTVTAFRFQLVTQTAADTVAHGLLCGDPCPTNCRDHLPTTAENMKQVDILRCLNKRSRHLYHA